MPKEAYQAAADTYPPTLGMVLYKLCAQRAIRPHPLQFSPQGALRSHAHSGPMPRLLQPVTPPSDWEFDPAHRNKPDSVSGGGTGSVDKQLANWLAEPPTGYSASQPLAWPAVRSDGWPADHSRPLVRPDSWPAGYPAGWLASHCAFLASFIRSRPGPRHLARSIHVCMGKRCQQTVLGVEGAFLACFPNIGTSRTTCRQCLQFADCVYMWQTASTCGRLHLRTTDRLLVCTGKQGRGVVGMGWPAAYPPSQYLR